MKVLLSIKPEFAEKIFDGTKKYEFRKSIFKKEVNRIVVYASYPIKQVIGEFFIEKILSDSVDRIWKETALDSGISQEFYQLYFGNKDKAYAIKVGKVVRYNHAKNLKDLNVRCAPQSFVYLK
jgi:predicted transcriptional regulator